MVAKLDQIEQGLDDAQASQHLVERVKQQVAAEGLDVYTVAKAQRAVADSKLHAIGGSTARRPGHRSTDRVR
jgi:hypothetical protein